LCGSGFKTPDHIYREERTPTNWLGVYFLTTWEFKRKYFETLTKVKVARLTSLVYY